MVKAREGLFDKLKGIGFLRPIPSAANYILCEVTGKMTSTDLTARLLNDGSIFIKDCKGKKGIGEKSFVRLAVRDVKDNDHLVACLKKIET